MIDDALAQLAEELTTDVNGNTLEAAVRRRVEQRERLRRRRNLGIVVAGGVAAAAVAFALTGSDRAARVDTIANSQTTAGPGASTQSLPPASRLPDPIYALPRTVPDGLTVAGRGRGSSCLIGTACGANTYLHYADARRGLTVAVLNDDAVVLTSHPKPVTVNGRPATLDHYESEQQAVEQWTLVWTDEANRRLALSSLGITRAELLVVAQKVEIVTQSVWDAQPVGTAGVPASRPSVERARVVAPTGELVRLFETIDHTTTCVVFGPSTGCLTNGMPALPVDLRFSQPGIVSATGRDNLTAVKVVLPKDFPAAFGVQRDGRPVAFARSDDGRFALIADLDGRTPAMTSCQPPARFWRRSGCVS